MVEPLLRAAFLGRIGYRDAWALQERLREQILAAPPEGESDAEALLLLEHPPVVTLGRATRAEHLLASPEALASRGVELVRTSRGGSATYHGPGQLVVYPVLRVGCRVRAHVERLCAAVARALAPHGVGARFLAAQPGLWLGGAEEGGSGGPLRKLAAVGVHVHRGVAIHGLAVNLSTDLDAYGVIVPCGQSCALQTSVLRESGAAPAIEEVARAVALELGRELGRPVAFVEPRSITSISGVPGRLAFAPSRDKMREDGVIPRP